MKRIPVLLVLVLAAVGCGRPQGGSSGRTVIENKGSDTLVNVAQAWAEAYQTVEPNVAIAVTGGGTGTGIAALINGTVDIANASREMKAEETEMAVANNHTPVEFTVGYDALAVYLHNDNPIQEISIEQLAGIYGESGTIERWDQLGVTVPGCPSGEIIRISRQNNSGTYEYFREEVLGNGDFKLGSRDMHGSKDVVDLVMDTPCAIGYSGLAYATPEVHMPCVYDENGNCITPSEETAIDRTYPIARPLFMYVSGEPSGPTKSYMDWILSDAGQCIIADKGYAPIRTITCPTTAAGE